MGDTPLDELTGREIASSSWAGDMAQVSGALGVSIETAQRYYLAKKRVTNAEEGQRRMAEVLRGPRAGGE